MTPELSKIFKTIFQLATYNEDTKSYQLTKEDYKIANITSSQMKQIAKIFQELGITIDYPNKPIQYVIDESLFREYNDLKKQLANDLEPSKKDILEQQRIAIRNKIVEGNMELIRTIINHRLNITNARLVYDNQQLEDLYQFGYLSLLNYLDNNYLDLDNLKIFICSLLIAHIQGRICTQDGYCNSVLKNYQKLTNLLRKSQQGLSIEILAEQLNIDKNTVRELMTLYNIKNPLSLEEDDCLSSNQIDDESQLEENAYAKIRREYLLKIIEMIPSKPRQAKLIASLKLPIPKDYLSQITPNSISSNNNNSLVTKAIEYLNHPLIRKYLFEIFYPEGDNALLKKEAEFSLNYHNKEFYQLELYLLRQLGEEEVLSLTKNLNPQFRENFLMYLGYIEKKPRYRFENETEYSLEYLRKRITELYVKNNPNEEIKTYFDYLMYNYLNKPRVSKQKIKCKIG